MFVESLIVAERELREMGRSLRISEAERKRRYRLKHPDKYKRQRGVYYTGNQVREVTRVTAYKISNPINALLWNVTTFLRYYYRMEEPPREIVELRTALRILRAALNRTVGEELIHWALDVFESALKKQREENMSTKSVQEEAVDLAWEELRDFFKRGDISKEKSLANAKIATAALATWAKMKQTDSAVRATDVLMAHKMSRDQDEFRHLVKTAMPSEAMARALDSMKRLPAPPSNGKDKHAQE